MSSKPVPNTLGIAVALIALLLSLVACGGGGEPAADGRASAAAERNEAVLLLANRNEATLSLSDNLARTELLDARTGQITDLETVVTGDRAVVAWYWTPNCADARREAAAVEQFAREHRDTVQVIGVGSQGDFGAAQQFLSDTGMETTTMLWERSGNVSRLNGVRGISTAQLLSHDLTEKSKVIPFDALAQQIFLDAAGQALYAPDNGTTSRWRSPPMRSASSITSLVAVPAAVALPPSHRGLL